MTTFGISSNFSFVKDAPTLNTDCKHSSNQLETNLSNTSKNLAFRRAIILFGQLFCLTAYFDKLKGVELNSLSFQRTFWTPTNAVLV